MKIMLVYLKKHSIDKIELLSWVSVVLILWGGYCTSVDIIPLNKWLLLFGSLGWTIVGLAWKKSSIWAFNLITAVFYLNGLYNDYFI